VILLYKANQNYLNTDQVSSNTLHSEKMNFKTQVYSTIQLLFLLIFLNLKATIHSNFKKDSILIANTINNALTIQNTNEALILINNTRQQIKNADSLTKQFFYFSLGKYFFLKGNLDSAQTNCNYGKILTQPNSNSEAKFYNLQGSIFSYKNKYQLAIYNFQKAVAILEKNNQKKLAAQINNNIANIFFSLLNYPQAYKYSNAAYKVMRIENDTLYLGSVSGILGISLLKIDSIKQAQIYIDSAIYFSTKYNSVLGLIIANYSKGELFLKQENYNLAQLHFTKSLQLSFKYNQPLYVLINSIGLGLTNNQKKQYNLAKYNLSTALRLSDKIGNKTTYYAINRQLAETYLGLNNSDSAYYFLNVAHEIYQLNTKDETQASINQLLIKYEYEKQKSEIANKQLIINKSEQIALRRNLIIVVLGFICVLFIVVIIFIYKMNKVKVDKLKKEGEIKLFEASTSSEERERERISNELHDELAASLTAIKLNIQNTVNLSGTDNNIITNQLTQLQNKVRSIAHNLHPLHFNTVGLDVELRKYCQLLNTKEFTIKFNCTSNNFLVINPLCAKTLYLITLELINNCIKHSKSTLCFVNLILHKTKITVSIEDEGVGFDIKTNKQTQGLNSIKNRLEAINGTFKIESAINQGALIIIEVSI